MPAALLSPATEDISFAKEADALFSEEFCVEETQTVYESQQSKMEMYTVMSDMLWHSLYPPLRSLARYLVCTSPLPYWRGQEDDLVEDITQETVRRVIERALKATRGEAPPIQSFKQMATTVAYNYYRDLKRHDYRLSHLDMTDTGMYSPHCYPVETYSDEYLLDIVADKVDRERLFDMLAREIDQFPPKQKQAILIDLANRMYFDEVPTSLQASFLNVGIELRHYHRPLPTDSRGRSRHISLCSQAYKRIAHFQSEQEYEF